jgi:hypothetical protein
MKAEIMQHVVRELSNIKCHDNPSNGSGIAACIQKDRGVFLMGLVI